VIPQRNLSLLANRLHKEHGGLRVPESVLERDYCLAWFLVGLSQRKLSQLLLFKGGTALKRCYFADYRFSEDLDFTLTREADFEEIRDGLEEVYASIAQASGIRFAFDREDRQVHSNSHTFYLGYQGPLPTPNSVKVDITISELVLFPIEQRSVLRSYEEFTDIPENHAVAVYSLGEIAAEKVMALGDKARNEPRDLYDLWYLTAHAGVQIEPLLPAIEAKLRFREKEIAGLQDRIVAKEARLKSLWENRLGHQVEILPEFEETFRALRRVLRKAGLP
jgi:predicted nucleotidyltransferase component of viral defense system